MADFTAALDGPLLREVLAHALAADEPVNPLWAQMIAGTNQPTAPASDTSPTGPDAEVLRRALLAPCVAAVSVTPAGATPRTELQISIDADGAIVAASRADTPASWSRVAVSSLPEIVSALAETGSRLAAPPTMTARTPERRLTLTDAQIAAVREKAASGGDASAALADVDGMDARLRDALTTDGDRADLAIHLMPPAPVKPVTLLRRWMSGELGLYSADGPLGPLAGVFPVEDGDFLGTVLPLLEEGAALGVRGAEA